MAKKYVKMVKCPDGKHRIKAVRDFKCKGGGYIAKGRIGGIIHQQPKGKSWVCEDSEVVQELVDSEVWNSIMLGSAPNERIVDSFISHCASEPIGGFSAYNSILRDSNFCNSYVGNCRIKESTLNDSKLTWSRIKRAEIHKVTGDRCEVVNFDIQEMDLKPLYRYSKRGIMPTSV